MKDLQTIPAVEARVHLGNIMKRAFMKGERFIVEKSGIPMVVILNATEYNRFFKEREERFKIIERIKSNLPDISEEEVQKDVDDIVKTIREKDA